MTTNKPGPPDEPMNDTLLILEDTDGDGRTDKLKTFAGDLHNPTGFEFWGKGVIVAQGPKARGCRSGNRACTPRAGRVRRHRHNRAGRPIGRRNPRERAGVRGDRRRGKARLAAGGTVTSAGRGTVGDLLFGTVQAGGTTLSSAWSTDAVFDEQYSDVLSLSGTGAGNTFVLSMSYDNSTPACLRESLNIFRRPGTSGPFAPVGTTFTGVGVPWTSAFTTVGQYGVDTTSQTVWVVNDTNSQFVVVPEPATLALTATAAVGIALARRRRLHRAA